MRCPQAREALSSWYDGEPVDADPSTVSAHVASCTRCTAFQSALGAIAELTDAADATSTVSDAPTGAPPTHLGVRLGLRIAVALAALAAVVPALADAFGARHEVHEVHESLAFTMAISVALVCAAVRPHLARAYLPVIGAAASVLTLTSVLDVDEGHVALTHELRHLGVLLGFVLVALLAGAEGTGAGLVRRRSKPERAPRITGVRLLSRSALPALAATFVVALLLLVGPPASAHAMLEGSTPAADAVLTAPPTSVDLVFNEAVSLLPDSVRVFGPHGTQVQSGTVTHSHGDAATASIGLHPDLPDGTYLVSYRVVSADSHPVEGAYTFVIGHPSRAPAVAPPTDDSRSVDVALGASRWLTYAGSALGLGGFAFLVWCWPAGWSVRRARLLVATGVGVLTLGTLSALLLKGPYDSGAGLGSATDGRLLREVLGTTYGRALDARLLLIAILVLLLTYREHIPARWLSAAPAVLLAATGVTFGLCGHAAAGSLRPLAVVSDAVHVAAMSIWLGGLVLLVGAVLVRGRERADLTSPVMRFSSWASAAVTALIATGIYQTLREVRSWDVLLHSHYGHLLVLKLGLVALAFVAAAGSRAWVWQTANPVVPVHAATSAPPEPVVDGRPSLGRLRVSVAIETVVLMGVLAATAMLVTSDPAVSAPMSRPVSATVDVGPDHVHVSAVPDGAHHVRLTLDVTDAAGKPSEPREVDASLSLSSSQIGPLPIRLQTTGHGQRTGQVSVPVAGDWQLAVTVRTSAIDEATGYVAVPIG